MKVRFLQDREVQDANAGTARATKFNKGQVADVPEASANHWITRGVAEAVTEKVAEKTDKKPAEK